MTDQLKPKIAGGLKWLFASQVVNQGLFIWFSIYLARILDPSMFGVVGLVTVITNYAVLFVDLGFGAALVQRKDLDQEHLSSVFWFNVLIGLMLGATIFFLGPLIAQFYDEPVLVDVARVLSVNFLLSSLSLVPSNLLDKEMKFKRKVTINWVATFAGYVVGISLAWSGYGLWSLVYQLLVTQLATTILLWFFSSWSPGLQFSMSKLRELLPFGLNVVGETSVNYWSRNADNFLIGKFVGIEGLGLYSRAYSLMLIPVRNISSVVSRVMFPAFSSIQNDHETIRMYYLKAIRYIAMITFPAMAGLTLVAKEFVLVCFGDKWIDMIPLVQWLAILGAVQSILNLNGSIYYAVGKPHIAFRVTLVTSAILLVGFVIGLLVNGLLGLTIAYFIAGTLLAVPVYRIAIRQIGLSLGQVFQSLSGPFWSSVLMSASIVAFQYLVPVSDMVVALIASIVIGMAVYFILLYVMDKEFKALIKR